MLYNLLDGAKEILKIQKFRRIVSYTGFYCFVAVLSYAYTNNTYIQLLDFVDFHPFLAFSFNCLLRCLFYRTRAGYSRADQFYASYPAGTELLTDTAKVPSFIL